VVEEKGEPKGSQKRPGNEKPGKQVKLGRTREGGYRNHGSSCKWKVTEIGNGEKKKENDVSLTKGQGGANSLKVRSPTAVGQGEETTGVHKMTGSENEKIGSLQRGGSLRWGAWGVGVTYSKAPSQKPEENSKGGLKKGGDRPASQVGNPLRGP